MTAQILNSAAAAQPLQLQNLNMNTKTNGETIIRAQIGEMVIQMALVQAELASVKEELEALKASPKLEADA